MPLTPEERAAISRANLAKARARKRELGPAADRGAKAKRELAALGIVWPLRRSPPTPALVCDVTPADPRSPATDAPTPVAGPAGGPGGRLPARSRRRRRAIMRDLTKRQLAYVEARLLGYPGAMAARLAGYSDTGHAAKVTAHRMERAGPVRDALCQRAFARLSRGRPVPPSVLVRLAEWPGLPAHWREALRDHLAGGG